MASIDLEYNSGFKIYNSDGTPFHDLVLHKCTYETVVMSLGDKISGILYYKDNALDVTMSEYIIYKGVRYTLVNPPTVLREGLVSDNSELRGMTKYSFTFYHPMYVLNNFPFSDIAVQSGQSRYLSQNKTFSWIGTLVDFVAKLNKNLEDTQWMVTIGNVTQEEQTKLSEVLSFDKNTIAEALKRGYETWEVPYVVDQLTTSSPYYPEKRFVVQYGLPTTEILDEYNQPFVFQMGQGVGLKNNSRNPKNNKIITRIAGYGSEDNIPYGYPQIPYYGGNVEYPLYYGIVGGQRVQLIKHPFTRNHLMPSVYSQSVYNKVNPKLPNGSNNPNYNPNIELVDYYDANDNTYTNRIKPNSPSYEIHEFGDIKPELGEKSIISAVPVSQQETQPDYKQKSDFLQEILDRISATEIEDEKTELLDVYDRVDRGLSYYEKHGEEGGDTYWFVFSITNDDYYEYVSYESSNYNFTATMLRDGSSAPTPDWDDTMDDDGNYLQSYFKITLPILEFDLYACAAITQEMKINMRSGACIGCTFPVEVDWDDYKRNFYNSDGEFDPDGEQRDYTKYPDSSSGQITVMVKKELETFGTLMPNQYQQPATGDKFVILGISLPNTYITSAEQRLDTDMKQYMRDNNVYYYDYPLKFDEHFLISHENILSQMKNNVVVRFNYAGTEHALYIKQMSVKYNESPLPKYDITLTDDIEIVLNQIGQVTDEVSKLRLGFGAGGFGTVGAEYLRKDIDDTARGTIRMIKGMQVGERFVTGLLGEGGVFRKDSDGTTYLETDKLYVRMKAYFDTVEVKHYLHTGGNRIASQASGIVCSRVEMIDAYGGLAMNVADAVLFRCFFKANDGDKTIRNDFMIGDLAFCRETNVDVSSVNLHGYWRLVVGRNVDGFLTENKEAWIDLSNRASDSVVVGGVEYRCAGYQNGSDAPIAQDDIIQLGNITDKDRQGAIVEYVGGEDAPSYQIFQGIGEDLPYPYTLEDKNYIGLGYSSQTGHAYMNVYGDVFIGAKPDAVTGESPTYIKYDSENEELTIKAVMEIIPTSTIGGETLEEYIQEHQTIYDDTDVLNAISDLENITDNLQDQIDGAIETLYGDVDPSVPANDPYRNYTTEEKENHLGDMYYNSTTGYAYRYDKKVEGGVTTYFWQLIRDSGITEAIAKAGDAVNLANTKGKIFTTADGVLPTPPYNINDLWVSAKGTWGNITYDNDIVKCVTARGVNATASISDWVKASKYTDDSSLQNFISFTYDPENAQLHKQIDGKIDTFFTEATEDPSSNWTTTALKEDHVDDVWYQTDTDRMFRYIKVENGGVTSYRWDEIYDELAKQAYRHAAIAQDTADGKRRVFVSQPQDSDAYDVGDLWVNASYTSGNEIIYDNDVLRCKEGKAAGDTFSISHWQKASKYTDDTDFNTFVQNTYSSDQANLQNQIDGKYETWFLNGVPTLNNAPAKTWTTIALKDEHVGDLYWDKKNLHAYRFVKDNQTYRWLQIGDNGVICAMADAANAQDTADKKRRVFLSEPTPPYDQGDLWTQGESGDIMMCVTSRSSGSYNAADWAKASKYTNDAMLLAFLDGYQGNLTTITNQVDAKLDTWVSSSDPSVRWTSNDLKELHVGDIWLNTNESTVSGVGSMKSAVYTKNGSAYSWVVDNNIPNSVFDTIDGKRSIYVAWQAWKNGNVNNLKERDLFIPSSDTTQGSVTYKANKVYRCTSASQETFQEVAYTDDTKVNAIIAKYGQIMNIQAATANDIGEALGHLREVLGGSTSVDGGLVLTNAIYMKDTAATPSIWAGISGVYKTDETGTGYKGHGTASWYGGGVSNGIPIDHEVSPSASNYAKSLFRFDGSGYLAGGNITWDAQGRVAISDITTLIGNDNTDVLNALTTFNSAFHFNTQQGTGTILSIVPQMPFASLHILENGVANDVATQKWVSDNYISIAFFNRLFQAYSSTTISDANKVAANDTTTAINNLKLLVGTWTNEYLSALGLNSSGSGGGIGDVTWSQLSSPVYDANQQIASAHLNSVTQPLYFLFNDDANPTVTYDGKANKAVGNILTKTYADGRYYQKIANGSASEVVLADGTSSKLKTINGNSLFGDGDITISSSGGTVTAVEVGTTTYSPTNGVVSLPAYLPLTGGILENADGITYSVSNSTIIAANPTSLFQSPIPKYLWHDVFAFCRASTPAYYTTTDNVNWTAATLDKRVFAQKEAVKIRIINPTGITGSRWVWSEGVRYTLSRWMVVGLSYEETQAHITIVVEKSSDGSTWTVLHTSSFRPETNATPRWISIPRELSKNEKYLRLTITKDPQNTTGATAITSIKLLTSRWGSQGLGSEYEYPYDWDANGNIFSISAGNCNLGSSSNRWFTIYGIRGDFYSDNAGLLKLKRNNSSGGAFIDYYPNNQDTNYWRAGAEYDLKYTFTYNNAEKVVITNTGNVGIGTNSPSYKLHVAGTFYASGNSSIGGAFTADSFIKSGGTASQFLKADGSVDENSYLLTSDVSDWAKAATKPSYAYSEISDRPTSWWGQSISSGTVSGDMTGVGSISASGNITITKTGSNASRFNATNDNGTISLYCGTGRGVYDPTNGVWIIATNGTKTWLSCGNVGIGTNSPSYKLHVAGTFYASSNSSIGGTLGVTGATTLSSTLSVSGLLTASGGITIPDGKTLKIGDAELSWDATNQGIKITKGLYSETFISALGAGSGGSSGGGGDVYWSQLTANNSSTSQQIHASHLSSVTQPLYFLFNEDSNPTVTYDGKTNKAVGNIITKSYADNRYYQKIANGSASEVVLADGTSSKLKTINGNSIFGDGDIVISSSEYPSGTAELLAAGTDTTDRVWSAKILSENVGGRQYYGTCSSAAATQAKVATIPASQNFRLAVGAIITIKFSNTNTFSATASDLITLNVNGTGAKQIWYNTSAANTGTNSACYGYKDRYTTYIYDGTYWVWVSRGMDTTYSSGTAASLTAGSSTTNKLWQAKILRDEFDKYLPLNGGTMTGNIIMGTNHYIYGVDESLGSILFFDGSRTVIGSCGATSTRATHLRSKTGHLTCGVGDTASYTIWDSGNDGSSSGLDADLLDGQHGNYYAAASSLNDYLLKAGGVMTGELHTHHALEVYNGSSSTKESSYMRFTRNGAGGNDYAALGWNGTNVRLCLLGGNGNYTSEKDALLIGYDGQLKLQASNGTAPLTTSSTTLVSNLNADLLDGKDGTYYVSYNESTLGNNVDCNTLSNFSGNGFVIQPIYTPNYTGQTNFPVRGYGTMVCLGGNGTGFPFRFALYQQVGSTPVSIYVQNSEWQKSNFVGRTWSRILTEDATFTAPNGTCGYATTAGSATTANSATTASSATTAGYATTAGSAPASDVYAWAKASTKPSYNFNEIQDAADLGVSIGTVTRRVLLTRTKTDQGYRSRAAIGLTNVSGKFSPVILSVGTNDGGTSWMDYTFTADGWFQSEKVRSRNVTIWGNQVTDDSKGLFIQASDWSNRAWITWNGNTETTDYLNIHSVYGNINLTPAKNVGIGTTSPSTRLHVKGRVTCEYVDSTILGSFCNVRGDYLSNYGINSSGFTIITTGQSGASSSTVRISMTPYNATEPYVMIGRDSSLVLGSTGIASDATYRDGTYIQIGGARIVWDNANTALKVVRSDGTSAANFYATGAISALGANTSGGGGGTLNQPLSAINTSGLSSPTVDGATLVWNSSKWVYSYQRSLLVHSLQTISGGIICYSTLDVNGVTTLKNTVTVNENIEMKRGKRIRFQQGASGVPEISIYTSSSDYNLHLIAASIYANSTIISSSDIRLKDVEQYIERDISSIAQAPIFYYRWKKNPELGLHLGSSAQYWSNVFKYAVMDSGEGYLGLDYSTTALAAAVITARKVQNHEDRIAYLERENENLRNRIKQLEAA